MDDSTTNPTTGTTTPPMGGDTSGTPMPEPVAPVGGTPPGVEPTMPEPTVGEAPMPGMGGGTSDTGGDTGTTSPPASQPPMPPTA